MAQKEVEDSRQQLMDQSGQKRDLSVVPQRPVDIKNDIARAASALDKMDMPALGHRFKEELGRTRELLDKASKGDPDALDNAKDNVDRLSALFKAESGMLQNVPAGLPKRLTLDRILDAIESTLEDAARAKPVLAAASIYASNAKLYNSERDERDSLLDFIVEKGTGDAKQDETALRSFRSNALVMQEDGKKRAASWHGEISRQLALVKSPAVRQALKALDQDLKPDVDAEEFAQRYHSIMGTPLPLTRGMKLESMRDCAFDLSKSPGDPAWYGTKALEALDSGDPGMASLALSMGMLSRAQGSMASQKEIRDAIANRSHISRPQLSRYLGEAHSAIVLAESARLEKLSIPKPSAELVRSAAAEIRDRASKGDMESARRLIEMADGYSKLAKSSGKSWPGSAEMEAGLRAELSGHDGTSAFEAGLARSSFAGESDEFRKAMLNWGSGLSPQKALALESLSEVEDLAGAGRFAEARRVLSCAVMYADAVVRLSTGSIGRPSAIDPHIQPGILESMETSLAALVAGEDMAGSKPVEDVFMAGYSECMQTYATLRASSLSQIMRAKPAGQEIIKSALEESKTRCAAGDFHGAISMLSYVEEFYGTQTAKAAAGWRYNLSNSPAGGFSRARDGMLQAIELEQRASKPEEHASAARLFESSLSLLSTTQNLIAEYGTLRRVFAGELPILPKVKSTAGNVPLEKRADGTYQTIPLEQVKGYESSDDAVLRRGPKLEKLLEDCRSAAQRGDAEAYDRAVHAFGARFGLVAGRAARAQAYSDAIKQIDQALLGLGQMREVYGSGQGRDPALIALGLKAMELRNTLVKGGKFPEAEFASLISDIGAERKIAMGVSMLNQQIRLGSEYSKCVKAESGDRASAYLDQSMERLTSAKALLIAGKSGEARAQYEIAIRYRTEALINYSAENAVNFGATVSAHRRQPDSFGIDDRFFPAYRDRKQHAEFVAYVTSHERAFDAMLSGSMPKEIQDAGKGTMLIESSIFGVPADAPSQFLDSFKSEQRDVRNLVLRNDLAGAERILSAMQERAETNRWVANAALIGVGIGSAFIPVVGVWVSGSIFTGMAVDRIATEYRTEGHASTEAWLMLGLTLGTMGIGAAAGATSRMALTARSAGTLARASRLASLSRTFTYANIGVGSFMFGYMGASTWGIYQDYREGHAHSRDVILSAGMAMFPVVHMSISGVSAYRAGAATRAMLPVDPDFDPSPRGFKPTEVPVTGFDSPQGIFGFMQRLSAQDATAMAQFERLPLPMRSAIESWMSKGSVRMALDAGSPNDLAMKSIRDGMDIPQAGTRAQEDMVLLTDRAQLAGLLKGLLSPGKRQPEISQRNAARATLERIRASSPDAARYIDRLLNDEDYSGFRSDLLSGKPLSQKNITTLQNTSVLIGAELPQEMRPIAASMGEREPIRASAGDKPSGKPDMEMGSVSPLRGSGGIEPKGAPEGKTVLEEKPVVPKEVDIPLSQADRIRFVERPKEVIRSLGLPSEVEKIALENIDDPAWLKTSNTVQVEMNQGRAAVLVEMKAYFQDAAKELGWSPEAIDRYSEAFISLMDVSERNGYTTHGHTLRVAKYTDMILRDMDMSPKEKAKVMLAALIHDVGKIGVPNELWIKPGKPSIEDNAARAKHAEYSTTIADLLFARIGIVNASEFKDISSMAGYHHELFDGTGSKQLKGTGIPIGTRIISLADSYDAMTSRRSYNKAGKTPDAAIKEIRDFARRQFDPDLANEFIKHIK